MAHDKHFEEKILHLLGEQVTLLEEILDDVRALRVFPVRVVISQGGGMPLIGTIKGLLPGASDTFFATPVDANNDATPLPSFLAPPSFGSSDTDVDIVTAPDGLSASVTAHPDAVPGSSFTLTWSGTFTNAAGEKVTITGTATVPILSPVPPPPTEPVSAVISQGSPAA